MKRNATAVWKGGIKDGKGLITTDSGVLSETQYSFSTRFEDGKGTNPEELIAAAHAGCYSMALSLILGEAGMQPQEISTKATVNLVKKDEGFRITDVHLETKVRATGGDDKTFQECAQKAKNGCPISIVLDADITLNATLVT